MGPAMGRRYKIYIQLYTQTRFQLFANVEQILYELNARNHKVVNIKIPPLFFFLTSRPPNITCSMQHGLHARHYE